VLTDSVLSSERVQIVQTAIKHRLPVLFDFRSGAEAGGLVSYGIDHLDLYRQTARFVADPKERLAIVFMAQTPGPARWHYRYVISALVNQAIVD
jgi:hypothetical protein